MKKIINGSLSVLLLGGLFLLASCGKDGSGGSAEPKPAPKPNNGGNAITTQGIHIPDANFKAALIERPSLRVIDANGDKEISASEALAVHSLDLRNRGIKDLTGLEYFKNLTSLYVDNNELSTLEKHIKGLVNLRILSAENCGLKGSIDIATLVKLDACTMAKTNAYEAIKVANQKLADKLNILEGTAVYYAADRPDIIYFTDINLENAFLGAGADLNGDGIITIAEAKTFSVTIKVDDASSLEDLKYFDALEGIEVNGSGVTTLKNVEIRKLEALRYIVIRNMGVETFTVEGLRSLETLNLVGNFLRTFTVAGMPKLRELILRERNLRELNVSSSLATIVRLNLQETQISGSLDLRNLTELRDPDKVAIKRDGGAPNITHIHVANSSLAKQLNEAEGTSVYTTASKTENVSVEFKDPYMKFAVALLLNKPEATTARNITNYRSKNNDPSLAKLVITKLDMENFTGAVKLNNRTISDLTGIEHFINASSLEINNVAAKTLDISKLVGLQRLVLAAEFASVKIGTLPKLTDVTVSYNTPMLDFSGCKSLKRLVINFDTLNIGCILVPENLVDPLRASTTNLKERIKATCE